MSTAVPLNLVTDPWLPVRRRSGALATVAPSQLTEGLDEDPIVAFAWSRPDFDAAARELLIGLLATTCMDRLEGRAWLEWWHRPPGPDEFAQRLAAIAPFFELDGDGPRFMQDVDSLADEGEVAELLIDSPGEQTLRENRDLFVKRRRIVTLGRSAAAMALFTLNAFAPEGGRGNRTSLRGGGPLTCLVQPDRLDSKPVSLWHTLWLNNEIPRDAGERAERRFAWCLPTRDSTGGTVTTGQDVNPLQVFWGMPRRVRLLFEQNIDQTPCDITGDVEPVIVRRLNSRPYGNNYKGWSNAHPLTPYEVKKGGSEWYRRTAPPGRLGYKDWIGIVCNASSEAPVRRAPAAATRAAQSRLANLTREVSRESRVVAVGYAMKSAKVLSFTESVMPLVALGGDAGQTVVATAHHLVAGADATQRLLTGCIRQGLAADAYDKGMVQQAKDRFWAETEAEFFRLLATAAATGEEEDGPTRLARAWRKCLDQCARAIFDDCCPLDPEAPRGIEAVIAARRRLGIGLNGYGKEGDALFKALGLTPPESGRKAGRGRRSGR